MCSCPELCSCPVVVLCPVCVTKGACPNDDFSVTGIELARAEFLNLNLLSFGLYNFSTSFWIFYPLVCITPY